MMMKILDNFIGLRDRRELRCQEMPSTKRRFKLNFYRYKSKFYEEKIKVNEKTNGGLNDLDEPNVSLPRR